MRIVYKPIKARGNEQPASYADICCHTNDVYHMHMYAKDSIHKVRGEADIMTSAHESSHAINNEMANANGGRGKFVGLYGLNDMGFVIAEPKVTISQVAQKVPQGFRGGVCGVYDLYMVSQAKDWGDSPLYICDEWTAYTNGATVAL